MTLDLAAFVAAPLDELWKLALQPRFLTEITPKIFGIRVISESALELGAEFKLEIAWPGMPVGLPWTGRIEALEGAGTRRHYTDVMVKGPFRSWRHEHIFEAGSGGTWVRDRIEASSMLGYLSRRADNLFAGRSLEEMIRARHRNLQHRFNAGS